MQNLFSHAERIENSKITTIIPPETETCKILKVRITHSNFFKNYIYFLKYFRHHMLLI